MCFVELYLFDEPCKDVDICALSYNIASLCLLEALWCGGILSEPHEEFPNCGVWFFKCVVGVH